MSWAAGTDPTRGMEGITARLMEEVEEDPDKERDLAKALLQERLNLRDFICQVGKTSHTLLGLVFIVRFLKTSHSFFFFSRGMRIPTDIF